MLYTYSVVRTQSALLLPLPFSDLVNLVPLRASFCFLPLMISFIFHFLSSALIPFICNCLLLIPSLVLSSEFALSILIHTRTLLICFSSLLQLIAFHIPVDESSTCWAAQTRLSHHWLPLPASPISTTVKMYPNSDLFLLLCSSSDSPASHVALQRLLPTLPISGLVNTPSNLSTVKHQNDAL